MRIRVATYNIHKGITSLTRRSTLQAIRTGLHHLDADIVFLQEVAGNNLNHSPLWPLPITRSRKNRTTEQTSYTYQLDILAKYHYNYAIYGENASYGNKHHGNAILSHYPILNWQNLDISDHPFERRGLMHAVVQIGQREIHLFCVHLGLLGQSRKRQLDKIVAYIYKTVPHTSPIIIAGDFNDWRKHLHTPLTDALNVQEVCIEQSAKLARTFPSRLPWLQLDRIYVRHITIHHSDVARGSIWLSSSDHRPLLAELSIY